MYFGREAIDSMFVLFGEILQCMVHRPLFWYGEKRIKHWENEHQICFDMQDRDGIMHAQGQMIGWREYLRIWHSIVYNFFDEEVPESADDKLQRDKNSSMSECSDPDYWHWVHFGGNKISWQIMRRTEITYWRGPEIPLIKPTQQVTSDYERMCHYENIIDAISVL